MDLHVIACGMSFARPSWQEAVRLRLKVFGMVDADAAPSQARYPFCLNGVRLFVQTSLTMAA